MIEEFYRWKMINIMGKLIKESGRLLYKKNEPIKCKELIQIIDQLEEFYNKYYK